MKIIQITDAHINLETESGLNDIDMRLRWSAVLDYLGQEQYDLLIFTGDLCMHDPHEELYEWAFEELKKYVDLNKFRCISGNHDDPAMMHKYLLEAGGSTPLQLYQGKYIIGVECKEDVAIIYLDTTKGSLSTSQKVWLDNRLSAIECDEILIFIHHPVALSNVLFMDVNHALSGMKDVDNIMSRYSADKKITFFTGHYHVERTVVTPHFDMHITPSLYVQIDSDSAEFVPDHFNPGYRVISWSPSGSMKTSVHYFGTEIKT